MLIRRIFLPMSLGLLVALGLALLMAVAWLGAPRHDLSDLARYLLVSGLISFGIGGAGVLWLRRGAARLWVQLVLASMLGVGIALFNISLTAALMFISRHDQVLLTLLLLFTAVVSLGIGYAVARTLGQRVTSLHQSAQRLAAGDLSARVPDLGSDELGALGREFNQMAAQLAASAAERAQMETARRELFAAVSHDLRTPLASLRAMTEALADGLIHDQATTERYLATMRSQINHLNSLIDDLFELAQIDSGVLKPDRLRVSPGDLISDTIEGLRPQATARGVALSGSVAPDVSPLLADPQKLERLLFNLVTNAIRHTPGGGSITLSARMHPETNAPSASILFEVEDTGEGIAPEDLPHVFDSFYRGEKSRSRMTGGAGLGLAIARGIVEAHGGRIWIERAQPHGTRVCFLLPQTW